MAFGCLLDYYAASVYYGCTQYNAYNADYGNCCNYSATVAGYWCMWIGICFIITILMACAR